MSLDVGIAGAGLSGALMAAMLAQRGHRVCLYERREDPRAAEAEGGRSINLALSHRGIRALDVVGVSDAVLDTTVPMRGRRMHDLSGQTSFQPYGTEDGQVIRSVSRSGLNRTLVERAAETGVDLRFNVRCRDVDLRDPALVVETADGEIERHSHDLVIGADGAFSVVRGRMQRRSGFDYDQSYLLHGYKELTMPPAPAGGFAMDPNALHIWPRGGYMMIALPNEDCSYTCTLFMPHVGENSFEAIDGAQDPDAALDDFFSRNFGDARPLLPDLHEQYRDNPIGFLMTVRCAPWDHAGRVVLIGDAAHAVVPFYGQGMNASFEDCRLLDERLAGIEAVGDGLTTALGSFAASRKPDTDALADLAIHNYTVMRDSVASRAFLLRRAAGRAAHKLFPRLFVPLYTMVTFTSVPYREAVERWARQQRRVRHGVLALVFVVLVVLLRALST